MKYLSLTTCTLLPLAIGGALTSCSSDDYDYEGTRFVICSYDTDNQRQYIKVYQNLDDLTRENVSATDTVECSDYEIIKNVRFDNTYWFETTRNLYGFQHKNGDEPATVYAYRVNNGLINEHIDSPSTLSNDYIGISEVERHILAISPKTNQIYYIANTGHCDLETINIPTSSSGQEPIITNIFDFSTSREIYVYRYSGVDTAYIAFVSEYNVLTDKSNTSTVTGTGDEMMTRRDSLDRIGASYGVSANYRYPMSAMDDSGNAYIFCGNSNTTSRIGVARIKIGTKNFDRDFYVPLYNVMGGYRFREVQYIADNYFLLDCYQSTTDYGENAEVGKYGILKIEETEDEEGSPVFTPTFTWVSGLPSHSIYNYGTGASYGKKYYVPVIPKNSGTPAIYVINIETGESEQMMSFRNNGILQSIHIVK